MILKWCLVLVCSGALIIHHANGQFQTDYASLITAYMDAGLDSMKPVFDSHANDTQVGTYNSTKCFEQLKFFKSAIEISDMWAIKAFDSWGKIPSGIFNGNIQNLGNFEQCLSVRNDDPVQGLWAGQYCLTPILPIKSDENLIVKLTKSKDVVNAMPPIRIALCIPDTCHPKVWEEVLRKSLEHAYFEPGEFMELYCQSDRNKPSMTGTEQIAL